MSARSVTRILAGAAGLALVAAAGQASFSGSLTSSGPTYTVQPGDSLWGIASVDGLTVDQLASANNLPDDASLQVGQVLTIPPQSYVPSSGSSSTVLTSDASSSASSAPTTATSTDQAGSSSSAGTQPLVAAPTPAGSFCATSSWPEGSVPLPWLLSMSPDLLALRPLFVEWANYYGIPPALVEAIAWQESGWQEGVVSPDDAVGIGQIIPSTAQFIDDDLVGMQLDPSNAADNIQMSAAFLGFLNGLEEGNVCNVIAAYYEGPLNLQTDGVFTITQPYVEDVEALIPEFQ
jgi:murein DD-endopeptidase MepM/ murein hydrolase activator NlpD